MKIAIGSDHAGFLLKKTVVEHLSAEAIDFIDCGVFSDVSADYPDLARLVSECVLSQKCAMGILICGTGIGMSIAANKYKNIRAALCGETFSAFLARRHNDANILTMGSRVIGPGLALDIVDTFIKTTFEGGRHQQRIDKISATEGC